jgi:hypothetical protein
MDPHSFSQLDPDPHSPKKLDQDPDLHKVNADPKHCFAVVDTVFSDLVFHKYCRLQV